jgi:DNA adenine methylase
MKPLFSYTGGKGRLAKYILPAMPPHRTYVEVFGGSGAILFAKEPSDIEVYNDFDSSLTNVYRCVRDPEKMEKLRDALQLKLYSKVESEENYYLKETLEDPIERAAAWLHCLYTIYGGDISGGWSWAYDHTRMSRHMGAKVSAYLSMIERFPQVHARLQTVQIENDSFENIIPRYDTPETLFYVDPPYITETRKKVLYNKELRQRDHHTLLRLLLDMKGSAIYSGYVHPTLRLLESNGWQRKDVEVFTTIPDTHKINKLENVERKRVESIWISPGLTFGDSEPEPSYPSES